MPLTWWQEVGGATTCSGYIYIKQASILALKQTDIDADDNYQMVPDGEMERCAVLYLLAFYPPGSFFTPLTLALKYKKKEKSKWL